jgi:hypothetical protein
MWLSFIALKVRYGDICSPIAVTCFISNSNALEIHTAFLCSSPALAFFRVHTSTWRPAIVTSVSRIFFQSLQANSGLMLLMLLKWSLLLRGIFQFITYHPLISVVDEHWKVVSSRTYRRAVWCKLINVSEIGNKQSWKCRLLVSLKRRFLSPNCTAFYPGT